MKVQLLAALTALVALAGCLGGDDAPQDEGPASTMTDPSDVQALLARTLDEVAVPMSFEQSVVTPAVDMTGDLYEPTMEVSDSGVLYITAHTILVDTTGAPVFFSKDDGASWAQLPFLENIALPEPLHGATPPVTDEIFLVAGDDGWLYGADITAATFPVNAWSGDGAAHSYYTPNAYDETQVALQTSADCVPAPAKDRPWAAYAAGKLLMVNNPASGPAQIGVMDVPPALPVGAGPAEATWNLCAGVGLTAASSSIPGIPDMRDDGLFAVPQRASNTMTSPVTLHLILGNSADVMDTRIVDLFEFSTQGEITSVYGQALFDADGTLFVGITNNTVADMEGVEHGQFVLTASTDGGETFETRTFSTGPGAIRHMYMDANKFGRGGLIVWAVDGETDGGYDWYVSHIQIGEDGAPVLDHAFLAIDEGPQPSAHVTGAAAGPDGRAYIAMYDGQVGTPATPTTPVSVFIQRDGPVLPIAEPMDTE